MSVARTLIAGMGNVLRLDDGFGVAVARRLQEGEMPPGVRVVEAGIGGISLVQEMLDGYDRLIVLDAVERDGTPGTLYVLEPRIDDLAAYDPAAQADFLADMHYATPERALILARALSVLPPEVLVIGCQPAHYDDLGTELSPPVADAVERAVETVHRLLRSAPAVSAPSGE